MRLCHDYSSSHPERTQCRKLPPIVIPLAGIQRFCVLFYLIISNTHGTCPSGGTLDFFLISRRNDGIRELRHCLCGAGMTEVKITPLAVFFYFSTAFSSVVLSLPRSALSKSLSSGSIRKNSRVSSNSAVTSAVEKSRTWPPAFPSDVIKWR